MKKSLTRPQTEFIESEARYPALVAGFGAGKTEALIVRRLIQAIQNPNNDFAFYEPTYDLIRQIAMPRFEAFLEEMGIPYKLLKSPTNELHIQGLGRIIFRSMDAPERIIGYEVADSDVDELDTLKQTDAEYVWRQILARNRQKKAKGKNTVAVATTPEGFRFVYNTWEVKRPPGYEIIRAPTYSNPYLPDDYVDSLRDIYPGNLLEAYIEGRFVNLKSGTIYISFARDTHNCTDAITDNEPLYIGLDFNVGKMAAVVHVKRNGEPRAVDEITGGLDTPDMIRRLRDRYGNDRSILIYPDASGDSRKSVDASKTDIALLKDAKFRVMAKKKNPSVRDRINCMNAAFSKGGYKVNIDRCPIYASCLEQQVYSANGDPDKSQDLDHSNDAAGYFISYEYPLRKPVIVTGIGMAG